MSRAERRASLPENIERAARATGGGDAVGQAGPPIASTSSRPRLPVIARIRRLRARKNATSLSEYAWLSDDGRGDQRQLKLKAMEPWRSRQRSLRQRLSSAGGERWDPAHKVSREAMDAMRALNLASPDTHHAGMLAREFKLSVEAVRRILRSKYRPSAKRLEAEERAAAEVALGRRPKLSSRRDDSGHRLRAQRAHLEQLEARAAAGESLLGEGDPDTSLRPQSAS